MDTLHFRDALRSAVIDHLLNEMATHNAALRARAYELCETLSSKADREFFVFCVDTGAHYGYIGTMPDMDYVYDRLGVCDYLKYAALRTDTLALPEHVLVWLTRNRLQTSADVYDKVLGLVTIDDFCGAYPDVAEEIIGRYASDAQSDSFTLSDGTVYLFPCLNDIGLVHQWSAHRLRPGTIHIRAMCRADTPHVYVRGRYVVLTGFSVFYYADLRKLFIALGVDQSRYPRQGRHAYLRGIGRSSSC